MKIKNIIMNKRIDVYTDMSIDHTEPRLFAYSILLINDDENETEFMIKESELFKNVEKYIKPHQTTNTNVIESYAILQALRLLRNNKTKHTDIVIYTDSEGYYNLYHNKNNKRRKSNNSKFYNHINASIKTVVCQLISKPNHNTVDIRCIKGHEKVYGNEIVNSLAKNSMQTSRYAIRTKLTNDMISTKAYEIYETTGNTDKFKNWVDAEHALLANII